MEQNRDRLSLGIVSKIVQSLLCAYLSVAVSIFQNSGINSRDSRSFISTVNFLSEAETVSN